MISEGYLMYILRILLIIVIIYGKNFFGQCILPIVMIIVNKVYFDRRKDIFVN